MSHCDRLKSGSDFLVGEGADCKGVETAWNFGERQGYAYMRAKKGVSDRVSGDRDLPNKNGNQAFGGACLASGVFPGHSKAA